MPQGLMHREFHGSRKFHAPAALFPSSRNLHSPALVRLSLSARRQKFSKPSSSCCRRCLNSGQGLFRFQTQREREGEAQTVQKYDQQSRQGARLGFAHWSCPAHAAGTVNVFLPAAKHPQFWAKIRPGTVAQGHRLRPITSSICSVCFCICSCICASTLRDCSA